MNKKYRTVYNKASKTWTLSLVNEEKQVSSRMNGKRFVFNAIASGLMIASGQAFAANGAVTTDDVSTRAAGTDNVCYFDSKTNAVICGSNASASSTGSVAIGTDAKAGGRTKPNTQTVDTADVNNIAIGQGAVASAQNPIEAIGSGNIAIGKNVKAVGNSSLAMGNSTGNYGGPQTYAAGADSYAIGNGARTGTTVNSASQATGEQSKAPATPALGAIAFGSDAWVKDEGRYGIAIGDNAYVGLDTGVNKANNDDVNGGVAIGRQARVTKKYATAMGSFAQAKGAQSIAIGGSSSAMYAAEASGMSSIALGEVTRSEGVRSVAIAKEANATATDSIAMGTKSKATAVNALAIGTNSEASAQNASAFGVRALANQSAATALGANTQATGVNAVAVGSDALSTAESGIAIGKGAKVQHIVLAQATNALNKAQKDYDDAKKAGGSSPNDEQKTAIATAKTALDTAKTNYTTAATTAAGLSKNSIAIGKDAQVEGMQSISIGTGNKVTGNNAGAYGDPSEVRGNNSYTFGNDNIVNTETSGAFILGNQNGMGTLGKYDDNGKLTLGSGTDTKNASNSVSLGNRNHITTEDTFVLGSGINTKGTGSSLTSIGSTVANSVYLGKDSSANGNEKADETKYQTLLDSKERGKTTTGGMAKVDKATVNGISYGGFAGNTPIGVVTVGYSGGERRIQNVAAGEISDTSTDAINGSQLYLITEGLSKQISGNTTALGGDAAYNPETKVYTAPTYNLYKGTSTPNTTGSNTQPTSTSNTVGDAITALNNYVNNGFNVKDNGGNTQGVVTPGESVQFINGKGTTSTVTTEANSVTKIQYDVVKSGLTANPSNGTVTATDKGDAFATAGDIATAINNSGFTLTAQGENGSLVKPGSTVDMKNTDGNILISKQKDSNDVTYNLSKDIKVNSVTAGNTKVSNDGVTINNGAAGQPVTLSANGLDNGGNKITNVAAGQADTDAVNVSQLNGAVAGSKENVTSSNKTVNIAETTDPTTGAKTFDLAVNTGSSLKTDPTTGKIDVNTDGNTIKQDPTTGALQVATTTITPNANGSVNAGDKTSLATAETVANAINQSGFNLTTSASEGTVSGSTNELVNPSETITLDAGKNIAVTQKGNTISVATKDEVAFKSVTVPTTNSNVVINKDGINAGNTKVTGVASGTNVAVTNVNAPTDAEKTNIANAVKNATGNMLTNAANIGDLQAVAQNVNGSVNNIINNVNNIHNILGGTVFTTYNVADNQTYTTNSVKSAIDRMNAEGIKYFHVNNEKAGTDFKHDGKTTHDSNAKGAYATAIGYDANAKGTSSIAIGHGAEATGTQSISIGTGNKVAGNHSGAFGDPNIINGTTLDGTKVVDGSYAFGNNNIINSANTFVLGNNVNNKGLDTSNNPTAMGSTVENSIYLGNQTTATADAGYNLTTSGESGSTTTGGATGTVNSATVSGVTYGGFAGATANGVVSVGASGSERRIQNVAAGEISATSTDAINGSQLYQTTSKVINSLPLQYSNVNAPVQSNGGSPTNHVTLVGANEQAPVTLHNVAEGVAPTDAVNVNQLYKLNNNLHYKMQNIADEADAGTASAMAAAGLPQAYLPGKSMVAVSGSTYRGKQGYAIGMSAISDGGNWVIKGVATGNSKGHFGATIGAGYQW